MRRIINSLLLIYLISIAHLILLPLTVTAQPTYEAEVSEGQRLVKEFGELTANPNSSPAQIRKKAFEISQSQQAKQILKGPEKSLGKIYNDIVYVGENSIVSQLLGKTKAKLSGFPPDVVEKLKSVRNKASIDSGSAPMDIDIGLITGGDKELERELLKKLGGVKRVKEFEEALQNALEESFREISAEAGVANIDTGKVDITGTTPWNEEAYGQSRVLQGDSPDSGHAAQAGDVTKSKVDKEAKAVAKGTKSQESAWQEAARGTLKDRPKMENAFNEIYAQTGKKPGWTNEQKKIWEYLEHLGRDGITAEEIRRINAEIEQLTGGKDISGACKQLADAIEAAWKLKPGLKLTPGQFIEVLITNKDGSQRRVLIDDQIKMRGEGEADSQAFQILRDIINRARGNEFINAMLANKTAKNLLNHAVMFAPMALMNMFVQYETGQMNDIHDLAIAMLQVVPFESGFQLMYVGDKSITDREVLNAFISEGFFWGLATFCQPCAPLLIAGAVGDMGWSLAKFSADSVRLQNYQSGLVDLLVYNGKFPEGKFEKLTLPGDKEIERWDMRRFLFETKAVTINIAVPGWGVIINNLSEKTEEVYNKYYLANDPAMSQFKEASTQLEKNAGCNKNSTEKYCRVYDLIQRQMELRRQEVIDAVMIPHLISLAEEKHKTLGAPEELRDKLVELQARLVDLRGSSLGVDLAAKVSALSNEEADKQSLNEGKKLSAGKYWQDAYKTYEKIYSIGNNIKENVSARTGYERAKLLQFKWTGNYADDLRMATQSKQGFASDIHKINGDIEKAKGSTPDPSDSVDKQAFEILGDVVFMSRAILDEEDKLNPDEGSKYFAEYKEALEKVKALYGNKDNFQARLENGARIVKDRDFLLLRDGEGSGLELKFTDEELKKNWDDGALSIQWAANPKGTFRPDNKSLKIKFSAERPEPAEISVRVEKHSKERVTGSLKIVLPVKVPDSRKIDDEVKAEDDKAAQVQPDSYTKGFGEQDTKDVPRDEQPSSKETTSATTSVQKPDDGRTEKGADSKGETEIKGGTGEKAGVSDNKKRADDQKLQEKGNKADEKGKTEKDKADKKTVEKGKEEITEIGSNSPVPVTSATSVTPTTATSANVKKDPKLLAAEKYQWIKDSLDYYKKLSEMEEKAFSALEKSAGSAARGKPCPSPKPGDQARLDELEKEMEGMGLQITRGKVRDSLTGEEGEGWITKEGKPVSNAVTREWAEIKMRLDPDFCVLHHQLECIGSQLDDHIERKRDIKAKIVGIEDSRVYKYFQEYAAFNDYEGYLSGIEGIRGKLNIPDPIPSPATLTWSYSSVCGGGASEGEKRASDSAASEADSKQSDVIDAAKLNLTLTVNDAQPYVGKTVVMTVHEEPKMDDKSISFWWEYSGNAGNPGPEANIPNNRSYSFRPKDANPVTVTVHAKAGDGRDDLTDKMTITAKSYDIKVTGPRAAGPKPQIWKCNTQLGGECPGLVEVDKEIAVHQRVEFSADVSPKPASDLRYNWTASGGSCALSNPIVKDVGVTCGETGSYQITVTVRDKDNIELGKGAGSLPVTISQNELNKAAAKAKPKVALKADKSALAVGEAVNATATVDGGKLPYNYKWNGDIEGQGQSVSFRPKKPGDQTLSVEVTDADGSKDSASITFKIDPLKIVIEGAQNEVAYGAKLNLSVKPDNHQIAWKSEPAITFTPEQSVGGKTTASFSSAGKVKIWAMARMKTGETIGESDKKEIDVTLPKFELTFDPPRGKVGDEIRAVIKTTPQVDKSLLKFIWISPQPSGIKAYDTNIAGFTPVSIAPVEFLIIVKETVKTRTLAEIKGTYTAEPVKLDVSLRTDKSRLKFGETASINADVKGGRTPYAYIWKGDYAGFGQSVKFNAKKAGQQRLSLEVTDARGNRGSADLIIDVEEAVTAKPVHKEPVTTAPASESFPTPETPDSGHNVAKGPSYSASRKSAKSAEVYNPARDPNVNSGENRKDNAAVDELSKEFEDTSWPAKKAVNKGGEPQVTAQPDTYTGSGSKKPDEKKEKEPSQQTYTPRRPDNSRESSGKDWTDWARKGASKETDQANSAPSNRSTSGVKSTASSPSNGSTSSSAKTTSSPALLTAAYENKSDANIHIFVNGENFSPNNRLAPGEKRTVSLAMPPDGRIKFIAGRNGQVISSIYWNGDPGDLNRYPMVKFIKGMGGKEELSITTNLK